MESIERPPPEAAPEAPDDGVIGAGGRGGVAAPAMFFGQPGRGSRFVYVLDKSGSMDGDRFHDACFELIRSIRALRPHEHFYIIFYDTGSHPMPAHGMTPATEQNRQRAIAWIRAMSIGGGTDPTAAMQFAFRNLQPDTIWLLSDGRFDIRVSDTISQLNEDGRAQINTIAFHDRSGETVLKRIARENGGDYRFVPAH